MNRAAAWLDEHTAGAPATLRDRVRHHALATPAESSIAETLARAGADALATVTARPGDRSVALDLLAADALITLALLEQAERDPSRLGDFAADLLRRYGSLT